MELPLTLAELDAVIKLAVAGLRQTDEPTTYQLTPVLAKARQAWQALAEAEQKPEE